MAQRTVCLCDGKYIGIESIFTVINGQQINIPEKLKELLDNETFLTAEDAYAYGLCDEIINPVESKESESVIKQALDCKNPVARKAIEQIRRQQKNADPKPNKASEPKQKNNAEWLEAIIKNEKLFKGVFK